MTRLFPLILVVAVSSVGCRKPLASPDYIAASNRYTSLLALHGDSAYAQPEMAEVLGQLGRVPPRSSDYAKAQELIARINADQQRAMAEEAKNLLALNVAPPAPNFPPLPPPSAPGAETGGGAAPVDAGAPRLAAGADFAKLEALYPRCFVAKGPITAVESDGGATQVEGYELDDTAGCRAKLPELMPNVLLVRDGKVTHLLPKNTMKVTTTYADGGSVPPTPESP